MYMYHFTAKFAGLKKKKKILSMHMHAIVKPTTISINVFACDMRMRERDHVTGRGSSELAQS